MMFSTRRHVLAALAAGIAAGDDDAARAVLAKTDWVLRRAAKRRLERALIDAALSTNELGGGTDPAAARRVMQAAYDAIARGKPAPPPPRLPIATIVAATLATGAACGTVFAIDRAFGPPPPRHYERALPPPAAGAFEHGGVPLADPAIAQLLTDDLLHLVIDGDRERRAGRIDPQRQARAKELAAAPAIAAHGPALMKAWAAMLATLDRWVLEPTSGRVDEIARDFRRQVRAVSDQLAAAGIGYYLEGDLVETRGGDAHALVYSYRVEEVVFVHAAGAPHRVLSLRRIDHLNYQHAVLGMHAEDLGDPVVLVDQIDEHVAEKILPVLQPNAAYPLGDDAWGATDDGKHLRAIAGAAARDELDAALGADAAAAGEIAGLVAERAAIVDQWRAALEQRNLRMPAEGALFLDADLYKQLDGLVPAHQYARVGEIEERLARLEAPRIASRCHQLVEASVRRHEAQHGLDADRDPQQREPAQLAAHVGDRQRDPDGRPTGFAFHAQAELSAYLSQIANDPTTPQLALWQVVGHACSRRSWGSAESYAAVLIVEGLAPHLGIASPGPIIHDSEIDRARLAQLAAPLAKVPPAKLREAARALWQDLFDEKLVEITDQ